MLYLRLLFTATNDAATALRTGNKLQSHTMLAGQAEVLVEGILFILQPTGSDPSVRTLLSGSGLYASDRPTPICVTKMERSLLS